MTSILKKESNEE
jgi:hypothetical protein